MLPDTAKTPEASQGATGRTRRDGQYAGVSGQGHDVGSFVGSEHTHARKLKVRRTGRHKTPSQVEKVAEKAGKAAPAMAIAGVLVAAPATQHRTVSARPAAEHVVQTRLDASLSPARPEDPARPAQAPREYTVQSGDTLSGIAERFYGKPGDWVWLYQANRAKISNPNEISVGEVLSVPLDPPAAAGSTAYQPRHAKTGSVTVATTSSTSLSGTLGCSGLEELWVAAGGAKSEAVTAAEIAEAESGGRQYALSPTDDRGYWQINASHGALSTYDPYGNARAAIEISSNGTNWSAWTTYTSGAYSGRC
jgi:LysM repeat protein